MKRSGLAIALVIGVVVGVLFGLVPRLDLDVSALFFNPDTGWFEAEALPSVNHMRVAAEYLIVLLAAPAALALVGKLFAPAWPMLIGGRAALFLLLTLALGPGLLANTILKDHWGRARPIDVTEFDGAHRFTPWWDPRGDCPTNCSFIAGEPSGAFWTLAPASLAPPQWRVAAYGAALAFGAAIGLARIAAGGHFFTDVVFAGVFIFLLIWIAHGILFRWPATRLTDAAIDRFIARVGAAIYAAGGRATTRRSAAFTPISLPEQLASLPYAPIVGAKCGAEATSSKDS